MLVTTPDLYTFDFGSNSQLERLAQGQRCALRQERLGVGVFSAALLRVAQGLLKGSHWTFQQRSGRNTFFQEGILECLVGAEEAGSRSRCLGVQ